MYIDYYPVEAIPSSDAFDNDVIEIRRAKRLTPIRDLVPRQRCYLHKDFIDEAKIAYCK